MEMDSLYRRLVVICLITATTFSAAAQQLVCGTAAVDPQEEKMLSESLQRGMQIQRLADDDQVYFVPLKIHIVRHSTEGVAISEDKALRHLAAANKHFIGAGLQFYMAGDFNYIDLDQAFHLKIEEGNILTTDHKEEGVINLFYPYNIDGPNGYAEFPPGRVAVVAGHIFDPDILIHELGHCFWLRHTHHGNTVNTPEYNEFVNGSNCEIVGDYICDTPADPYGLPGATGNCNGYTGTIVDFNGDTYAPMMENFMSYWSCKYGYLQFTMQQHQMMRLVYGNYYGSAGLYPLKDNNIHVNSPSEVAASFHSEISESSYVRLTWQDNSSNETSFFIERSTFPDKGFFSVGYSEKNTTSFDDKTVEAELTYYYRIRPANSNEAFSGVVSVQTSAFYCVPTAGDCSGLNKIINSFNLSSGATVLLNGSLASSSCFNYLSLPTSILEGANTYSLSLKIENSHEMFSTAWIDYNRDMRFDEEEVIYTSGSARNLHTASFNTPGDLVDGLYRLRIRVEFAQKDAIKPCEAEYLWGEIRDFEFMIKTQKIFWEQIADKSLGDAPFPISATSTSSLPINYIVVSGPAVLEGNILSITDVGIVTLRASQTDAQTGVSNEEISFCVLPSKPQVFVDGGTLTSSSQEGNQWYLHGQPIADALQQSYQATTSGVYAVKTTGPCGSGVLSEPVEVIISGLDSKEPVDGIEIFPNPASDRFSVKIPIGYRWEKIEIIDLRGIKLLESNFSSDPIVSFSTKGLLAGIYIIKFNSNTFTPRRKIIVQR